jgi:phosphomannomutase/phosphoglucomutase
MVNQELTPEFGFEMGLALATYMRGRGKVAVGYDTRTSSVMFEQAITAGLTSGGCDVVAIETSPTPVLSFAIRHFSCEAGVMITASHNPPQYNGIKLWGSDGGAFSRKGEREIERIISKRAWKRAPWDKIGKIRQADALTPYIEGILNRIPKFERELKVVVDCANATGSLVTPVLLRELGCKVISMNCQIDGTFPGRNPEPTPENIKELSKAVVTCGADLGIAHDGDADRTAVVNEKGEVLTGDRVFALVALHHLRGKKHPKIVTGIAASSVLDDVARELGGEVVKTPVGEPEIVQDIREHGGDLGGEETGSVIFPEWTLCREGMMTALKFIEALVQSGKTVSEFDRTLPQYFQIKQKTNCPNEIKGQVLNMLSERFAQYKLNRIDGLRVDFDDGWLLLRPSGTEPIFRCFSEAKKFERAKELAELGMRELEACAKIASQKIK